MSVEKYRLVKDASNYTIFPNEVLQNMSDYGALGLYVYLMSLPHEWQFHKKHLAEHGKMGREKLDKYLRILKAHNLIKIIHRRNEQGRFDQWDLYVNNGSEFIKNPTKATKTTRKPKLSTEKTPLTEKPLTANRTLVNSTYKENIEKENNNKKERERGTAENSDTSQRISLTDFNLKKFEFNEKETELAQKSSIINPYLVLEKFILHLESKGRNSFMRQELQIWLMREVEYRTTLSTKAQRSINQGAVSKPNETKCAIPFFKPDNTETRKAAPETISHYLNEIRTNLGMNKGA